MKNLNLLPVSWLPIISLFLALTTHGFSQDTNQLSTKYKPELVVQLGRSGWINCVAFSPDGKYVLTGSYDHTARLWETSTGKEIRIFIGHIGWIFSVAFSPDEKNVLTGSADSTARLWETATGKEIRKFKGHMDWIWSAEFSPAGNYLLTGSEDGTTRIWETLTGKELCKLVSFDNGTWAVIAPDGRYDASNDGNIEGLHWVVGLKLIELNQLRERYYEPGLLAKIMGFNKQPFRNIEKFDSVALPPEVDTKSLDPNNLQVTVKDIGGGIGRIEVYVNDSLFLKDSRPPNYDINAKTLTYNIDVSMAPTQNAAGENHYKVVAYNKENWLPSRGAKLISAAPKVTASVTHRFYAVIAGCSEYASPSLRLNYAGKDADSFAQALTLGAKRCFESVDVNVFSTSGAPGTHLPTKENLRAAFERLQKITKPDDILVVFLAGHGVALRSDNSSYCYLTQDANSAESDKLASDKTLRDATTITDRELADWLNKIPASYRVMVLDTCAAGSADKLTEKRAVSEDQIRAMARFKDNTGVHLLMGCMADKSSYEASKYGQGLLTYAVLEGMKGASLKENQWVDVATLFNFVQEEVPKLAGSIGGAQQPQYKRPEGASFDIGKLTADDRKLIPLSSPLPQLLRPQIGSKQDGVDDLELGLLIRTKLLDESFSATRGSTSGAAISKVVYVDSEELAGAIRPFGQYVVNGNIITVHFTLLRDQKRVGIVDVKGLVNDKSALAELIIKEIESTVSKLSP